MERVQVSKEELKQMIEEIVRKEMEKIIDLLEDIFLTPEEKKLLENVKERIKNNDYSEFIHIEDVKKMCLNF